MEIIDAHAHIYPAKIAEKATTAIGKFYDLPMEIEAGTAERLVMEGKKVGVSRYVVHSVATTAHQVYSINDFIKREIDEHPEFIGFMTLHPDLSEKEIETELERCIVGGFKGVKLHPDFQKFYIDGEDAEKIYRVVGNKLPILMHMGDERYEFSRPHRLANVAKKYSSVNFIAAHFGGYQRWHEIDALVGLDNVYFDTCSSLAFIGPEKAEEIIRLFGVDKFFFGTDYPMWDAKRELELFYKINLTDEERKKILAFNVKKLLKIR